MNFKIIPAAELSLAEQAAVANRGFAGYLAGWTEMNASDLARFLLLQGADSFYSRFVANSDGLAGLGYINRTGNISRLGAMALVEEARGTGAGDYLLGRLLDEARTRGDAALILEVIEQNPRALALYRRHGFKETDRLVGWRRKPAARGIASATIEEVPILRALEIASTRVYPEVAWSISRHAVARVERTRAFVRGTNAVVISDPAAEMIRVHAAFGNFDAPEEFRAILEALLAKWPEKEFFAIPVWPEEWSAAIFPAFGFQLEPLSQFLMRRDF